MSNRWKSTTIRKPKGQRPAAIYHAVYANEGYETSARKLFNLLQKTQEKVPNKERHLYLDIDGHTDTDGQFDMQRLKDFLVNVLNQYFTAVSCHVLFGAEKIKNAQQNNNVPAMMPAL